MTRHRVPLHAPVPALVATALLYMVLAEATAMVAPGLGHSQLLPSASGLALALLFIGGRRLLAGVLVGAFLSRLSAGDDPLVALAGALGVASATQGACLLLGRQPSFDRDHPSFHVIRHVLWWACGVGAGVGALVTSTGLWLAGAIEAATWPEHLMEWWMGCALAFLLVTPLVMAYWRALRHPLPLRRLKEGVLVWCLSLAAGQVIFGNPQNALLDALANAYWMFLFVSWSGARLGMLSTMGLVSMIALQALWGTSHGTGFFAHDIERTHGFGYWSYLMILGTVGLSLSAYLAERRRQITGLSIAATAFECQEGMLVTDRQGAILQANASFARLTGYPLEEILGRSPDFLCPNPVQPDCQFVPGLSAHRRETLVRKSGDPFPAWITVTPVSDAHGRVSHHVVTLSDITSLQEQEQRRQLQEQAQRSALVREVHHRIKNNLQGIVGMLRALDHRHPTLHEPINQMMDQIHSIAVIHGLQGRSASEDVWLCELTRAIAQGIAHNWSTPVQVDIPPVWNPCRIASPEAVPVALVLNELIVNAVKHGGQAHQDVQISLRKGTDDNQVQITLSNPGRWPPPHAPAHPASGRGLDLVTTLMPRSGMTLARSQIADRAVLQILFAPPVILAENHPNDP